MFKKLPIILLTVSLFCFWSVSAFGAGFNIYEHGAKATGVAGAFAARADDPSAVFFNPAGLAYLDGWNIYAGGTILIPEIKFAGAGSFPGYGIEEETKDRTFFPPAVYLSYQLAHDFAVGFGIYAPFALATEWNDPDNYSGRYISQKAELTGIYFSPSFSYAYNEMLSVGINANIVYSAVELNQMVNKPFYGQV